MHKGYLIKVNNTIIPESLLAPDGYKPQSEPVIVNDYLDGNYDRHVVYAPQKKVTITLKLRKMTVAEFASIAPLFEGELSIEYYDFLTDSYKNGIFTSTKNIVPPSYSGKNPIYLNNATINLVRKRER